MSYGDTAASVGTWWRQPLALAVLAVLAILALLAVLNPVASPSIQQPEAKTSPTRIPVILHSFVLSRLARAVIAYDAPEGQPLGAIKPSRGFVLLESRTTWQQLDFVKQRLCCITAHVQQSRCSSLVTHH